tara:strand:- start:10 stop:693 length:684 start_codon:yes stop_codon:yes gene_type:complete
MKYKKILFLLFIAININADEVPFYSAKYKFESNEIKIEGVREFKKTQEGYEMTFNASNLLASMNFSSKFQISNNTVYSEIYDIKIKPKFLDRDQSVKIDYAKKIIESSGRSSWKENIEIDNVILDPLNAQIMIRTYVKKGIKKFSLNIIDMQQGGTKKYFFKIKNIEDCSFNRSIYKCYVVERVRDGSIRKVKYFLAKELGYMFIKIIDKSPETTNTLELQEILSFG